MSETTLTEQTIWATAAELAGLPEMPQSERGVRLLAERLDLLKRKKRSGKGYEYHTGLLPLAARQALQERQETGSCPEIPDNSPTLPTLIAIEVWIVINTDVVLQQPSLFWAFRGRSGHFIINTGVIFCGG
ncbi:MAG: hypothetical protein HQM06_12430 [Magnetococcales bacterium]|nr:hypothetical protein [Magnetococcales bacterium]